MVGNPNLSATRLSVFQRCTQKYHYQYDLGLPEAGAGGDAMLVGAALHEGIAQYYLNNGWEAVVFAMEEELSERTGLLSPERMRILKSSADFLDWYIGQDKDLWKIQGVEEWHNTQWEDPDGELVKVVGKWDLVVWSSGKLWIVDHKFSKKSSSPSAYTFNLQADMYLLQAAMVGMDVGGVIFNLVNYRKREVKKQVEIRTEKQLERLRKELETLNRNMREYVPVRTLSHNCRWDCAFQGICLEGVEHGEASYQSNGSANVSTG